MLISIVKFSNLSKILSSLRQPVFSKPLMTSTLLAPQPFFSPQKYNLYPKLFSARSCLSTSFKLKTLKYSFTTLKQQEINSKIQEFQDFDFEIQLGKDAQDSSYLSGMKLIQQGNWPQGYKLLSSLLLKHPNNYGLLLYIGLISEYHNARDILISHFQRALKADPPNHPTLRKMRAKLARNYLYTSRTQEGHELYKQLIEQDPEDWGMEMHYAISIELSDPVMYRLVEVINSAERWEKEGKKEYMYEVLKMGAEMDIGEGEKKERAKIVILRHLVEVCKELGKEEEAKKYQEQLESLGGQEV